MRILLSLGIVGVILTAVHGWDTLSVITEAPRQLVSLVERAR